MMNEFMDFSFLSSLVVTSWFCWVGLGWAVWFLLILAFFLSGLDGELTGCMEFGQGHLV